MTDLSTLAGAQGGGTDQIVQQLMAKFGTPPAAPNLAPFQKAKADVLTQQQGLTPPTPPTLAPIPTDVPKAQVTSAMETMGTPMMLFALLAGGLSGNSMTGAFNNAASLLKGVKTGDAEATNNAYKEFTTHLDAAKTANASAVEQYKTAFQKYGADSQKLKDELAGIADQENDTIVKHKLDMGQFDEVYKIIDAKEKLALQLDTHKLAVDRALASSLGNPERVTTQDGKEILAQQDKAGFITGKPGSWVTADENHTPITGVINASKPTPGGQFTPEMGALMGALAEKGVSLPTGFRSKEQQIELYRGLLARNPGKSPDEIAESIKSGQIEFGAQKKETQVAAGQAGKIQVAANEITENIPYLRELTAKVPRGNFVPINRLLQTADANISDPNLKRLKIAVIAMLNAYDQLAARGGTDVEKRAEAHRLLTSADGPQAFEAALQGFQREAEIAKKAAVEATKAPSAGGPKPGAPTLDEFIKKAKPLNPDASDNELKAYWEKKYGNQ